jgi:hypothetical protein
MQTFSKRIVTAAVTGVALLGMGATTAQAQFRGNITVGPVIGQPGIMYQNSLRNIAMFGRAISFVPPYALGYNPYVNTVNISPGFGIGGYNPYLGAGGYGGSLYNPFLSTGYGGVGGYGANTLTSTGGLPGTGDSSYGGGWNPYMPYIDPYGGVLRGVADVISSEGQFMIQTEQARNIRAKWRGAQLENQKRAFDLEAYMRANTPTYAEQQERLAKDLLRRIQSTANQGEIWSGAAQNVLLRDFGRHLGQKSDAPPIPLEEEVLEKINVTANGANLGLLRNDGKLRWPIALTELASQETKKTIDLQAQELARQAQQGGNVDVSVIRDLKTNLNALRDRLVNKVNEIGTGQYADAKRFLNSFDDAIRAVERGDTAPFFEFRKFVRGGKSVQEVVDFMTKRGLTFAPMVDGDEAAYQALYMGMASFNVAVNQQLTTTSSGSAPQKQP